MFAFDHEVKQEVIPASNLEFSQCDLDNYAAPIASVLRLC